VILSAKRAAGVTINRTRTMIAQDEDREAEEQFGNLGMG
jgi:hypothetical protein